MVKIQEYSNEFHAQVAELVTSIQQKEFGVNITYEDQPDLQDIQGFFQKGKGNFWISLDGDKVVGSIALIDLGDKGAIRKMFVHKDYRGSERSIAKALLDNLEKWSLQHDINQIFLGTVDALKAAHRFYEKNGYQQITIDQLPQNFLRMEVDTMFFTKKL